MPVGASGPGRARPLRILTHDAFTILALSVGLALYYRELRRRGWLDETIVWISLAAVFGGLVGARLITSWAHPEVYAAFGDRPLSEAIEHSGKSLIGALAGGDLAIVLMKRAFGYRRSTGDAARHADGPAVGARELVSLDDIGGGRVLPVVS